MLKTVMLAAGLILGGAAVMPQGAGAAPLTGPAVTADAVQAPTTWVQYGSYGRHRHYGRPYGYRRFGPPYGRAYGYRRHSGYGRPGFHGHGPYGYRRF
ncbi:hypothetical protein OPKNFCMD_6188 [Methylobacterium crusticola]|uniref:Sulfur globule protein n=1 Tax=Methylobacterium crusticola TaxID=1697972 RepID=A0ABQ4R6W9_9HYPH|nr:hypothetical protein [Methylobacterium crusticola]GJD53413.1 hypothetical protein OPKNFCMD_6188 [Methylobacterium crusticola]